MNVLLANISIAILIILITILGVKKAHNTVEGMESKKKLDIGNILCAYYHRLLLSIVKQEDFHIEFIDIISKNMEERKMKEFSYELALYENGDFIQHLPTYISFEHKTKPLYEQFRQMGINLERMQQPIYGDESTWRINDAIDEDMHTIMKPLMQQILNDAFIKSGYDKVVDFPVIHFRCADTPFVLNPDYALQKHCFFKKALEDIQIRLQQHFQTVIVLSYVNHRSNPEQADACAKYAGFLTKYLEELAYDVNVRSESSIEDFATIFYAPASISTSSSFSFMAGFFGMGIYISTTNGFTDGRKERCMDCGDWVYKGYNLHHHDVPDYLDTDAVLVSLQTCPE